MILKTREEFEEQNRIYDLMLIWKDSEKPEDKESLNKILEDCGFWANSKAEETQFLIPYDADRRSYLLTAPKGYKVGDFPIPGDYSFALVTKKGTAEKGEKIGDREIPEVYPFGRKTHDGSGTRESEINFTEFSFNPQQYFSLAKYHRGYLFTFLEEKKELLLYNSGVIKDKNSPYYEKYLRNRKREEEVKQECIRFIPALTHYTWPDELEISGKWEEKELSDPDFFKKTFELLTCHYYTFLDPCEIPFHPLKWENGISKVTQEITYEAIDENERYMYGIIKKRAFEEEIGVWLKQEDEHISLDVKVRTGDSSFDNWQGKLFPDKIELTLPFFNKTPKGKAHYIKLFGDFGLEITNL